MQSIPAKTIVTRTKSEEWFGTRYNMNIYRGCCHGCIYCDSRSSCYRNQDFDTVKVKETPWRLSGGTCAEKCRKGWWPPAP